MSPALRPGSGGRSSPLAQDIRTIAVVRARSLGGLLMATPAWRALRRRFPHAEITLMGLPQAADLAARLPRLVDRFVPLAGYPGMPELPHDPASTAAFLAEQRAYGYDLALQMHDDGAASNSLVADLGACACVGLARPGDDRLDVALPYPDDSSELLRWLALAAALGAPIGDTSLELCPSPADDARAIALLAGAGRRPRVGLHVGAADAARRWPLQQFAALAAALGRDSGAVVVLTGGPADRPLTAEVAADCPRPTLDLAGRTDLGSFAAVVARLDLLVTNDCAASQVAAAMGTPSVVLFGPTRPAEFGPLDLERHRALDACAHAPGADGAAALRHLPLQPVLKAALAQLARFSRLELAERRDDGGQSLCAD